MNAEVLMRVRGSSRQNMAEGLDAQPHLNNRGEQIIAAGLPPLAQIVSQADSWWVRATSGAAPVVAIPTTAALFGLWNGEADGGKSIIIDSVIVMQIVVTAAIQNVGVLANISTQKVTTPLANTLTPRGLLANRAYGGKARVAVGITLDATIGVADAWMPLGQTGPGQNTLQVGTILDFDVKGGIILPPGGQLALTAIAGAATAASVLLGVRWHEAQLPNMP